MLSREVFQKMTKCGISETDVNSDKTLTMIGHIEYLTTQKIDHPGHMKMHFPPCDNITTSAALKINFVMTVLTLVQQ